MLIVIIHRPVCWHVYRTIHWSWISCRLKKN